MVRLLSLVYTVRSCVGGVNWLLAFVLCSMVTVRNHFHSVVGVNNIIISRNKKRQKFNFSIFYVRKQNLVKVNDV